MVRQQHDASDGTDEKRAQRDTARRLSTDGDLDGEVAIVTGGNSGIGEATALRLAAAGANVLITGRNRERLEAAAEGAPNIDGIVADMTDFEALKRVVQRANDHWGPVSALVNNAAAAGFGPIGEQSPKLVRRIYETNVIGPSLLLEEAVADLREQGGTIVNVAGSDIRPRPHSSTFGVSKRAMEHLTRYWAVELAPEVRVNAVAPGPTATGALERAGLSEEQLERMQEQQTVPLGRSAEPEEIAEWIVRLADSRSDWVTGQVFPIDGGYNLIE